MRLIGAAVVLAFATWRGASYDFDQRQRRSRRRSTAAVAAVDTDAYDTRATLRLGRRTAESFSVNPEACARIERIKGKLVVIAVAGLYRTGKSFLLNLLVRHARGIEHDAVAADAMASAPGFAVGGTVNACTKGIWMWGEPIVMDDGTSYLFLDTEGLGSVDREQTHDTRIFALALLLATNFIYNSRGVIDGNAIEDLSLVVNLSKHIQTSSSSSKSTSNSTELHEFFPSFLWVVRDFTLQLQDNGKKISSKQYLESALAPTGGYSDDAVAKDQIRSLLADFFRQRDCVTLVRPVDDEQQLRQLPTVPYANLRDEFRSAFETLRKRLLDKAKPKMLFGKTLDGAMYTNLVTSYVDALNSGKAPVISSAWSRVVQAQCDDALAEAIALYKHELHARVRVYESPEQYELDAAFVEIHGERTGSMERRSTTMAAMDFGQGDNAMFDEHGNLRMIKTSDVVVDETAEENGEDAERDMIDVMEHEAAHDDYMNDKDDNDKQDDRNVERTRLPCADATLARVHQRCKRLAKAKLKGVVDSDVSDDAAQYMTRFRAAVAREFEPLKQQNAAASMAFCRHVLAKLTHATDREDSDDVAIADSDKSAMELHRETQVYLQQDVAALYDAYFAQAIGPSADAAYCEFITQCVVNRVIERTERSNVAHMADVRALEAAMNALSVQVAVAQGQATAMHELALQQQQTGARSVVETQTRCANELAALRSTLEFKTNELEHVLHHNATLKRLADTAQQGQYRATEFATSAAAFGSVLAGYLIKQQQVVQSTYNQQHPHHQQGGAAANARSNKWQQRYFVLHGSQLSVFDTKDDYERCRSDNPPMDVTHALIEDTFAVPEAFSVSFADNKYYPLHVHAKSLAAKTEWVDALRRAAAAGGHRYSHDQQQQQHYQQQQQQRLSATAPTSSASQYNMATSKYMQL